MTMLAGKMMLERSPLFRGLSPDSLQRLASLALQRKFRNGDIVFSQGDPGDALYGVIAGRVRISAGASDGREIYLNIMQPGDTFGEIALLDGGQRTATATATEASELVSIRREQFLGLIGQEPSLALELLRLCGQRLRWTSGQVEDAALLDVPTRLAKRLLGLVQQHGRPSKGGVTLRLSQEELASFLGVSRQIVNQYLQGWRTRNWVRLGRGVVTVCDEDALRKLVP
jgi:CRP-like cAMP-binding protein